MAGRRQSLTSDDPRVIRALRHPLRVRILAAMSARTCTPRDLADALGEPLPSVAYHVKVLADLGIVDLVDETRVRGAVAHHYKARPLPAAPPAQWKDAAATVKQAAISSRLADIGAAASAAAAAGHFDGDDAGVRSVELRLDGRGQAALARLVSRFEGDLEKLAAKTAKGETQEVQVVTMHFKSAGTAAASSTAHRPRRRGQSS